MVKEKTGDGYKSKLLNVNLRPFFFFGLLLVLFITPFMRGLFFPAELYIACILVGVAFLFCIYDQVLTRKSLKPQGHLDWAVLALVPAYVLSLINAVHMGSAIRELMEVAACVMIYICAARAVRHEKHLDLLLTVCYTAGFGVAVIGLLAATGIFGFPGAYGNGVIMSTLQYKNALAVYLVLLNVVGLGLSVKHESLWPKLFYAVGNFLFIVVILGTQSRGGWIIYPLAVGGLIALLPVLYRWRAAYHLTIVLGVALVVSRAFYGMLRTGENSHAGMYIVYGAVAVVALQTAYHFLAMWLNREEVTDATRRLVAICGISYFAFVGLFYVSTSAGAVVVSGSQVVPVQVARRAETISAADPSFKQRIEYSRDALRIIKDYPLTGAGGGGWNALYHKYQKSLYWSTETHNHFFQTWVEAGTIGFLSLLAVWVTFILLLVRFWRHAPRDGLWVSLTAAAIGVITLGLHSAFDFDLSLPALTFLTFTLFGGVREAVPVSQMDKEVAISGEIKPVSLALPAILGTIAALALILTARSFYVAGTMGALGAQSLAQKDIARAEGYYVEAQRRDPFTASYAADLAQIYAVQAVAGDDAIKHYQALNAARRAVRAEPYNTSVRAALVNLYLFLKEPAMAVREAEALLAANPMIESSYEVVAGTRLEAARHYLRLGNAGLARPYLKPLGELIKDMEKRKLEPTPRLLLTLAENEVVAGRHNEITRYLEKAGKIRGLAGEAAAWQAVALERSGNVAGAYREANRLKNQDPEAYNLYELLKKESRLWRSL